MAVPGRFGAVVTAMVTPFGGNGSLDVDGAVTLARWLTANGSDALVVAGSTGEATSLSDGEKIELWKAVSAAVSIPVIAGSGSADTRHSVELTTVAQQSGVDAVLVVCPYYSRPSQSGIEAHFKAVAAATSLPVIVYDIPSRTGRRIAKDTLLSLAANVPNVVAVKDATGDVAGSARLVAEMPSDFELYSGDDALTLPLLSIGASGVISVASHWAGTAFSEMIAVFAKGDINGARALNSRLLPSFQFESSETTPNPMPAKAMMRIMGLPAGQCRLPVGPAPTDLEHTARAVLSRLRREAREANTSSPAG